MTMSTQTLAEAARILQSAVLVDALQIMDVGEQVTNGFNVTLELLPVGKPTPGLVQTTTLENATESRTTSTYSVKVPVGTELAAGQAVKVLFCRAEPGLADKILYIDKVSQNGLALIRKAVASDYQQVNQEGKATL